MYSKKSKTENFLIKTSVLCNLEFILEYGAVVLINPNKSGTIIFKKIAKKLLLLLAA